MNKSFRFSLLTLFVMLCGSMFGAEVTWTASEQGYENGEEITSVALVENVITATFDKGTNSNSPKYYNAGTGLRLYGGNTMTIAATGVTISKIELTFGTGEGSNAITTDVAAYSDGVWTGSASNVVFTIGGTSGHRRIATITVTYSEGGEVTPPAVTPGYKMIWEGEQALTEEARTLALSTAYFNNFAKVGDKLVVTVDAAKADAARGPKKVITWKPELGLYADETTAIYEPAEVAEDQTTVEFVVTDENKNLFWTGDGENILLSGKDLTVKKVELVEAPVVLPGAANIAAFKALEVGTEAVLTLTDAFVTKVNNGNAYVQDATGALYFYNTGLTLTEGTKLNGTVTGKLDIYLSLPEFAKTDNTNADDITATEGAATPKVITVAEVAENVSMLVQLKKVDIVEESDQNKTLFYVVNGDVKYQIYDQFKVLATDFTYPAKANITAIVGNYKGTLQLYPVAENSIEEVVAPVLEDGKYYLKNVTAQKFWGAGNSWGTQASLVDEYQYVKLTQLEDGKYTMESMVSNGGTNYYFAGDYMDGAATGLDVAKVGDYYTFALNGQFFGYDGTSTVLGKNIDAESQEALWQVMTEEDVLAEQQAIIASATVENPANVSFLIKDANFGRNRRDKDEVWTMVASNKNLGDGANATNDNGVAESYHAVFTLSQVIENAPKGIYRMTAQGFYRQDGSDNDNLPVFYINDETATFPLRTGAENSMTDAGVSFKNGLYVSDPMFVELTEDGTLTVGAKLEENTELWAIWDNFELTYYGADATMDEVKNGAILAQLNELREQADALKGQVEVDAVVAALENALAESANVSGADAINAAIETLKAAIDKGEASVIAKNVLPKMKAFTETTNFYTEAALNEYYTQWVEKYEAGTLTKVEATGLQNPELGTGWHAAITVDNFLLSVWDTNPDFVNAPYYINTWSVEGDNDGTNFRVPFFEYWTGDGDSLGERTLTATLNGLETGDYTVTAWVRVRIKNNAEAPAYGIEMQTNEGETVNVADGEQHVGQFYLKEASAKGTVAEDGVLTLKFKVAADNNISWLSFKNVNYKKEETVNIAEVNTNKVQNGVVYNLAGQQVKNAQKGLYIINGKKVVK